jgi:hypothetical protein
MLTALAAATLALTPQAAKATVNDLAFMEGQWQCPKWGGTFQEHWLRPTAGTMQGVGKLVTGDKTGFMEFMSIEPGEKGLVMYLLIGSPAKQQMKAAFTLTSITGKKAVFEDPQNDFPSKITYERLSATSLKCTLEGKENGKPQADVFDFKPILQSR